MLTDTQSINAIVKHKANYNKLHKKYYYPLLFTPGIQTKLSVKLVALQPQHIQKSFPVLCAFPFYTQEGI